MPNRRKSSGSVAMPLKAPAASDAKATFWRSPLRRFTGVGAPRGRGSQHKGEAQLPSASSQKGAGNKANRRFQRRLRKAESEIEHLRTRVLQLEHDIQESRLLNRRLAEVIDVVSEVLLPTEQRDERRLRELLDDYDKAF